MRLVTHGQPFSIQQLEKATSPSGGRLTVEIFTREYSDTHVLLLPRILASAAALSRYRHSALPSCAQPMFSFSPWTSYGQRIQGNWKFGSRAALKCIST